MIDRYVAQCQVRRCYICNRNPLNTPSLEVSCNVRDYTLMNTLFLYLILFSYVCLIFHTFWCNQTSQLYSLSYLIF